MKKGGILLFVLALLVVAGGLLVHFYFGIPAQPTDGRPIDTNVSVTGTKASSGIDKAAILATYVGQWHVHGYNLTINTSGMGSSTLQIGPCTSVTLPDPNIQLCEEDASLMFTVNVVDRSLKTTVTAIQYTSGGQPYNGTPVGVEQHVGDTFVLIHNGNHLLRELTATYSTDLCDTYASNAEWQVCGA